MARFDRVVISRLACPPRPLSAEAGPNKRSARGIWACLYYALPPVVGVIQFVTQHAEGGDDSVATLGVRHLRLYCAAVTDIEDQRTAAERRGVSYK
jgi:hypothetical protein